MALSKSLLDFIESAGGEAVLGISGEVLEDATAKLTKGALRGHAGAVARLKGIPGWKFMRFFGHAAGHTAGMVVDLLPGLDPETRGLLKAVIQHLGSGAGAGAAHVVDEASWQNLVETIGVAPGVAPKRPSDNDEVIVDLRGLVRGEHWPLRNAAGVPVKDRYDRYVPCCAVAVREIDQHTREIGGARSKGRGGGATPTRVEGPNLDLVPHSQAKRFTDGDPVCRGCMAAYWIDQSYQEGLKDWWDKTGVVGEWGVASLRLSLAGRRGLAKLEAKAMMEAVTTAPVKPWVAAITRILNGRDPATTPVEVLPEAIVEDLLALIDWQGKGEKTKVHKVREVLQELLEWWRAVGRNGSRPALLIVGAYFLAVLASFLLLFVGSWLLMPEHLMEAGAYTAVLSSLVLIVLLWCLGPINTVVSWLTDVLPFVDRISDEFSMTVRKYMSFFASFAVILALLHLFGASHLLRGVGLGIILLLLIVPIANFGPWIHLRTMAQRAASTHTFLFLAFGSVATILILMIAAGDQHIIPRDYVMQVAVVDVQQGVRQKVKVDEKSGKTEHVGDAVPEITEEGLHIIPSPDGKSHFRVDELPRAFAHLNDENRNRLASFENRDRLACFALNGPVVSLPGYRLKEVPGSEYGCLDTEAAYMMYPTPWRTFVGTKGIGWWNDSIEYAGLEDMAQTRHAREQERIVPFFSRVSRSTYGEALLVFGIALLLCGIVLAAKSSHSYVKWFAGVAAVIGVLMIAGCFIVYHGELEDVDRKSEVISLAATPPSQGGATGGLPLQSTEASSPEYIRFCADLKAQGLDEDWRLAGCHL